MGVYTCTCNGDGRSVSSLRSERFGSGTHVCVCVCVCVVLRVVMCGTSVNFPFVELFRLRSLFCLASPCGAYYGDGLIGSFDSQVAVPGFYVLCMQRSKKVRE